jgi:KipI family sensor histidine kinase inhibitor
VTGARPVRWFGDGALVADVETVADAHALAAAIGGASGRPGVEDVVVGYRSVTVVAEPTTYDLSALAHELAHVPGVAPGVAPAPHRRVEVPVCLDGPDLDEVAALASMSTDAVVAALLGAVLTVAFVGFLPGFAYLDGLPDALAAVPRRATPRTSVPAGSLSLGGGFAGIYPQASPGGWQLVGRSAMAMFDPGTAPFAALAPGDEVRLHAVAEVGSVPTRTRAPLRSDASRRVDVVAPGLLTMVQDLGRIGVAALGVPRAGAADPMSLRAANRLVGNADGDGALEITASGPRLRFHHDAHLAVVGRVEVRVDGRPVDVDTVVPVASGQELSVGATRDHLRCYLAVSGGFEVEPVFGSRSSDVLTGLGPGPLRAGDVLGVGPRTRPRGRFDRAAAAHSLPGVVRVMAGPDALDTDALERLAGEAWEVGPASDRMGVRLRRPGPLPTAGPGIASRGMVTGAVQLPPDGIPVALLCDHATVGGYPVVATVVRADLGLLGQLRPGDSVRFDPVDQGEADQARRVADLALDRAVTGWYPVRSD